MALALASLAQPFLPGGEQDVGDSGRWARERGRELCDVVVLLWGGVGAPTSRHRFHGVGSAQNCEALLGSHCSSRTMDGSLLAPLMNSSRDSLPGEGAEKGKQEMER